MEFVRMKGPMGKGHAEMAVSKTKNSDYVTPDYDGDFPIQGWDQELPLPGSAAAVVEVMVMMVEIKNFPFQIATAFVVLVMMVKMVVGSRISICRLLLQLLLLRC